MGRWYPGPGRRTRKVNFAHSFRAPFKSLLKNPCRLFPSGVSREDSTSLIGGACDVGDISSEMITIYLVVRRLFVVEPVSMYRQKQLVQIISWLSCHSTWAQPVSSMMTRMLIARREIEPKS